MSPVKYFSLKTCQPCLGISTSVFSLLIFLSGKLSWRMYQRPSGLSSQYQAVKHKTFYRQKPNVRHPCPCTSRPVCLSERCCPSDRAPGGQTGGLTMDLYWWVSVSWDRGTVWVCLQCREERQSSCQQTDFTNCAQILNIMIVAVVEVSIKMNRTK